MCIIFFQVATKCVEGNYRLILASNRDEFYYRKSKCSHYWEKWPTIVGGLDLESHSLGTWLAASSKGKIGCLLNIQEQPDFTNIESRGVLIPNYLIQDVPAENYVENLMKGNKFYNGYHLVLFDITKESLKTTLLTSTNQGKTTEVTELFDGIHGLSNSSINQPYKKVLYGKKKFEDIVQVYNSSGEEEEEELVIKLLALLKLEEKQLPDDILYESKKYFMPPSRIEKLSSVFVKMPEEKYGTRTHTIILINRNNEMIFRESTMIAEDNSQWSTQKHKIQLHID